MGTKVNFLIVGAQKSGTTALDAYLRAHPEIAMGIEKEVHFFDNDALFSDNTIDYSIYHNAFEPRQGHVLIGESTPIYMYWHEAPKRIWQYNPDMKIIMILRNPIERAFSHWNMERSRNAETLSFWEAITSEKHRLQEVWPLQHRVYSYIDRGFYSQQLENIWRYFPKKNTLALRTEDLNYDPQNTINKLLKFLGASKQLDVKRQSVFSTPYQHSMTDRERAFLIDIFKNEIAKIEQLLDWDCRKWIETI